MHKFSRCSAHKLVAAEFCSFEQNILRICVWPFPSPWCSDASSWSICAVVWQWMAFFLFVLILLFVAVSYYRITTLFWLRKTRVVMRFTDERIIEVWQDPFPAESIHSVHQELANKIYKKIDTAKCRGTEPQVVWIDHASCFHWGLRIETSPWWSTMHRRSFQFLFRSSRWVPHG